MALDIPRVHILFQAGAPRALASRRDAVSPDELKMLVHIDLPTADLAEHSADRCLPLANRRWAVGRRRGARSVWRIVDEPALHRLGHPAWLWTEDAWFDPRSADQPDGAVPAAQPLRHLVRQAASIGGSRKQSIKSLVALVAALRESRRGTALVVGREAITSASAPARWMALALLATLPPSIRESLRVGVGEIRPDPHAYDVVFVDAIPEGYRVLHADDAPDEGRDLVAFYVRNRLHGNDPEAIESAAFLYDRPGEEDGWGEGIKSLIRGGVPGVSIVTDEMIERDAEGAVRALRARIRAGADIDERLRASLVEVTVRTRDHRPWRPLAVRPAVERADAVGALLERSGEFEPRRELIEVLGAIQPRGANLVAWCATLLRWIPHPELTEVAWELLYETLHEWPPSSTRASRTSVWSEAMTALMERERYDLAWRALGSPLARSLADEGGARVIVDCWLGMPFDRRPENGLSALLDIIHLAPDREPALAMLFRTAANDPREVRALVRAWRPFAAGAVESDPLYLALYRGGVAREWIRAEIEGADPAQVADVVGTLTTDPLSPLWVEAEELQATALGGTPRDRLLRLGAFRNGLRALDALAVSLVPHTLATAGLPDPELSEIATAFATTHGSHPVWGWVAVASAEPEAFDDETVEATVADSVGRLPNEDEARRVARAVAHALGQASTWTEVDHARWVARLVLVNDAERFGEELALEMLQAVARRSDGVERMAGVTHAFCDLPDDHPAMESFTGFLLPQAWLGGVPKAFVAALDPGRLPPAMRVALRLHP